MVESSPNSLKTRWEKKKLLVMSNCCFSHSVFKRQLYCRQMKMGLVLERVSSLPHNHDLTRYMRTFENILGKGDNTGNQHFFLFPQCFLPYQTEFIILATMNLSSAYAFNLVKAKILSFGKDLKCLSQLYLSLQLMYIKIKLHKMYSLIFANFVRSNLDLLVLSP